MHGADLQQALGAALCPTSGLWCHAAVGCHMHDPLTMLGEVEFRDLQSSFPACACMVLMSAWWVTQSEAAAFFEASLSSGNARCGNGQQVEVHMGWLPSRP